MSNELKTYYNGDTSFGIVFIIIFSLIATIGFIKGKIALGILFLIIAFIMLVPILTIAVEKTVIFDDKIEICKFFSKKVILMEDILSVEKQFEFYKKNDWILIIYKVDGYKTTMQLKYDEFLYELLQNKTNSIKVKKDV